MVFWLLQVDGELVSRIGPGLLCLIGVGAEDTQVDAEFM
jgi:D-Tyr-tRNAtyr deacylase